VRLSYPDWVVERLVHDLGAPDAVATLEAQNEAPAVTLRPNPSRVTGDGLALELEHCGMSVGRGALVADAVLVRRGGDPAAIAAVAEGRATPQDQASQAVVRILAPAPGDQVLDVAAAPGGKATACGELVGQTGLVVALDVDPGRLRLLSEAAGRLRLAHVRPVLADGRRLPVTASAFDRVLVDAPCSGLGVLRRRPEARWRLDPTSIASLADLQTQLVLAAAGATRVGGVLVYSVCTLTEAETTGVGGRVLAHLGARFVPLPPPAGWRPAGSGALVLPHDAGTDGMFVLALERVG
jgi:16S rRNA (cytosine967-C5)-methyltransferase